MNVRNRLKIVAKNWGRRGRQAKAAHKIRGLDKTFFKTHRILRPKATRYYTDSGLPTLSGIFKTNFYMLARHKIRKANTPIKLLDIGAGEGLFGIELQTALAKEFRGESKIKLYANGLTRPYHRQNGKVVIESDRIKELTSNPFQNFAEWKIGEFNQKVDKWYTPKSFDIIVGMSSPITWNSVARIATKLKDGGNAFLQVDRIPIKRFNEIAQFFRQNGYRLEIRNETEHSLFIHVTSETNTSA